MDKAFGVSVGAVRAISKTLKGQHALAEPLWATGFHEARLLATMVADPNAIRRTAIERWLRRRRIVGSVRPPVRQSRAPPRRCCRPGPAMDQKPEAVRQARGVRGDRRAGRARQDDRRRHCLSNLTQSDRRALRRSATARPAGGVLGAAQHRQARRRQSRTRACCRRRTARDRRRDKAMGRPGRDARTGEPDQGAAARPPADVEIQDGPQAIARRFAVTVKSTSTSPLPCRGSSSGSRPACGRCRPDISAAHRASRRPLAASASWRRARAARSPSRASRRRPAA